MKSVDLTFQNEVLPVYYQGLVFRNSFTDRAEVVVVSIIVNHERRIEALRMWTLLRPTRVLIRTKVSYSWSVLPKTSAMDQRRTGHFKDIFCGPATMSSSSFIVCRTLKQSVICHGDDTEESSYSSFGFPQNCDCFLSSASQLRRLS
jgi:hypothetical protein